MPYTIKEMVDSSPYDDAEQDIKWTGDKKTRLVTLNAATGQVVGWFGPGGDNINELRCSRPNGLADADSEECSGSATITLGRTESQRIDLPHRWQTDCILEIFRVGAKHVPQRPHPAAPRNGGSPLYHVAARRPGVRL